MAGLKDIRRWARGEHVQGLPPRKFKRPAPAIKRTLKPEAQGLDKPLPPPVPSFAGLAAAKTKKPKPAYGKARYKISADGTDALIMFGKHRGQKLSDIADKDATYCDFIIREEFPADLKDVARYQKRESRERAKKIKLFEDED